MRLKQIGTLLLASVMMVGTIGMMNPTQVQAETPQPPTNQYTLTVPAETTLAYDGSAVELTNGLKVSDGDLADGMMITITAASAGDWKLSATGVDTKINYGLYASSGATETTTSWKFSKSDAANTGTTETIYSKITASDYDDAEAGDYSDTITFTAKVEAAVVEYAKSSGGKLSSNNLGTPVTWTYGGITYDVYNAIIASTASANWNDAMGFVVALNRLNYDGHNDWTLLSSKAMAESWNNQYKGVYHGGVKSMWTSVEYDSGSAWSFLSKSGANATWSAMYKTTATELTGFVVLRPSSSN